MSKLAPETIEAMRSSILAGRYNLLLGAGANRGATDATGQEVQTTETLRTKLIALKALRSNATLQRAYSQLSTTEIEQHITIPFANCSPSKAHISLTSFVWNRIFTLNLDNCLEIAYKTEAPKQRATSVNFDESFRNNDFKANVQIVHVHGDAKKSSSGYIFSLAEYAASLRASNAWALVLAHTISTEPFIIVGSSLEEPDLEYFWSGRTTDTVRTDRGPSILVEPFPDGGTLNDCERLQLTLYQGTLEEFVSELNAAFPNRPSPLEMVIPLPEFVFKSPLGPTQRALFDRDFEMQTARHYSEDANLSFYVGAEPTEKDFALQRDVARDGKLELEKEITKRFQNNDWSTPFLIYEDLAGGGKTTTVGRVLFDLASNGYIIFKLRPFARIDLENSAQVLTKVKKPFIIFCDNLADNISIVAELFKLIPRNDFLVLGCDRQYRTTHSVSNLGGIQHQIVRASSLRKNEVKSIVSKLEGYGMSAKSLTDTELDRFARECESDTVAVAICRIINDYRPLDKIVDSLVLQSDEKSLLRFVAVALAVHCYHAGLNKKILTAAFDPKNINAQFSRQSALTLKHVDPEGDYTAPMSNVVAERTLARIAKSDPDVLYDVFTSIGAHLVPYVNRDTIIARSPEARLAGRLFDYDETVATLLESKSEKFFVDMKRYWAWNSRFWEQFALLKLDQALRLSSATSFEHLAQAVLHARNAVRIERHPFPLTTLGKVLMQESRMNHAKKTSSFAEAFATLAEAIEKEGGMRRIAIHPFIWLFKGCQDFIDGGGSLTTQQREKLEKLVADAERFFPHERPLMVNVANLKGFLRK